MILISATIQEYLAVIYFLKTFTTLNTTYTINAPRPAVCLTSVAHCLEFEEK